MLNYGLHSEYISTGWNERIVALEKTTWFLFRLMKTGFLFRLQTIYKLASCVQIPREKGAYCHVWNNLCSLPIQVMTKGPLPTPSKCKSGLPRITGTCPGWWKQSFRLRLWSLVWFQVRATACHLTSWKSAWKSTPKYTWICWRVWWSPGAIRWPVADPGYGSRSRRRAHKF